MLIGQTALFGKLLETLDSGRVPHAWLFSGEAGRGALPLALAYAGELICRDHPQPEICRRKCRKFQHPDLHFAFPVATNSKVKSHPVSSLFLEEWREFLATRPYGNLFDWYRHIGVENKQGQIGVEEARDIVKRLRLKPYEGTRQVMIIWMAEKMNTAAANKLLKIIEEPPPGTVFILITGNDGQLIDTLRSRCQIVRLDPIPEEEIRKALVSSGKVPENEAEIWAKRADGSYGRALYLLEEAGDIERFDTWFVTWVRAAFKAKGNPAIVLELTAWAEDIASYGREVQKEFLKYALEIFRQALLIRYGAGDITHYRSLVEGFDLRRFAPFVHNGNIVEIVNALESAIYHIQRNAHAKLLLLDLSMKLTRLLHRNVIPGQEKITSV